MSDQQELGEHFEEHRNHLRAVATRLLGSATEADDAVQDAWLRASRADSSDVANLRGWLTTIVSRVCLTRLQARRARPEQPLDEHMLSPVDRGDPEGEAVLADAVGAALLVVLNTLSPAERLAFVLHDLFAVPFDEVARVVDRSPAAVRQLASRARRRVARADALPGEQQRAREAVKAFLAASREGDLDGLLVLLDPHVVLRADAAAVSAAAARVADGAPALAAEVRGASAVAQVFLGRARAAVPALVDGQPGAVWAPDGSPRAVFDLTFGDGVILAIDLLTDPDLVRDLHITLA